MQAQLKILIDLAPNLKPDQFAKLSKQSQRDLLWFMATTLPKLADQEDLSHNGQETTFEVLTNRKGGQNRGKTAETEAAGSSSERFRTEI